MPGSSLPGKSVNASFIDDCLEGRSSCHNVAADTLSNLDAYISMTIIIQTERLSLLFENVTLDMFGLWR